MTEERENQVQIYSKAALRLMRQFGINPTPQNYQIWYCYATGEDPDLKMTLDAAIRSKRPFTEERNAEIAEQFFSTGRNSKQVYQASSRLQSLANSLLSHIEQAGKDNSAAGERVANISSDMAELPQSKNMQSLAEDLMKEAQLIETVVSNLQQSIDSHNTKLTELRASLVKTRKEATTDPLTGLANRRACTQFLTRSAAVARETGNQLSIILLDIDHFKSFNDTHGHLLGDEVLKIVANKMKLNLKGQDMPARYGGEEFMVILPDTALDDAATVADKIRRALCDNALVNKITGEKYGTITASFGVSSYKPGEALDDFIQRADEALYRAKTRGRNCVVKTEDERGQEKKLQKTE